MQKTVLLLWLLVTVMVFSINPVFAQSKSQSIGLGKGGEFLKGRVYSPVNRIPSDYVKKSPHHASNILLAGVRRLVPQQYSTIQAAINACADGDTVLISEGTYLENIRYKGKAIVVASLYLVDGDTTHIEKTIIDGSGSTDPDSGSVVYFIDGEDTTSVLYGLTITGGTGTINVDVSAGQGRLGGGVFSTSSGARLCNNRIVHNNVSHTNWVEGGGLEILPDNLETGVVIIESNLIAFNEVSSTNHITGGGGLVVGGTGRIINNQITDNICSTQSTQWYALGGGLEGGLSNLVVENNLIARNKALAPNSQRYESIGGGVYYWATTMQFCNNTVIDNLVQVGNNMSAYGGGMGFHAATGQSVVHISGNLIANNTVLGGGNSGGGGIYLYSSLFHLENNIIIKNSAYNYGGGMLVDHPPKVGTQQVMINNTFFDNIVTNYGGGVCIIGGANIVSLNNVFWADTAEWGREIYFSGATTNVQYCDVQGGYSGTANINSDPQFIGDTFLLSDSSLCIGAGKDSIQIGSFWYKAPGSDFSGLPRPNPVGSNPDMGACENPLAKSVTRVGEIQAGLLSAFDLKQNYPNPFNPSTNIQFSIPKTEFVTLTVFNLLGQQVTSLVSEKLNPGIHKYQWHADNLPSGIYYCRMQAGEYEQVRKMVLLR